MRRRCTFRKTDVTRATKAVQAAGLEVARVQVGRDGVIVVFTDNCGDGLRNGTAAPPDDLDRELADFKARHGEG